MEISPIDVISRWAHVGTAILLVGGTAFFRLAVIPALGPDSKDLVGRIRENWKKFVHIGILLFLVSGFYNYIQAAKGVHKGDSLYHMLVGIKMLMVAEDLLYQKPSSFWRLRWSARNQARRSFAITPKNGLASCCWYPQ